MSIGAREHLLRPAGEAPGPAPTRYQGVGDGAARPDIRRSPPHIAVMPHLDLSDEEEAVLAVELVQLISRAEYPFSDRVRTLGAILKKLRPEPARVKEHSKQ